MQEVVESAINAHPWGPPRAPAGRDPTRSLTEDAELAEALPGRPRPLPAVLVDFLTVEDLLEIVAGVLISSRCATWGCSASPRPS